MKQPLTLAMLACMLLAMTSCMTNKISSDQRRSEIEYSKEQDAVYFVKMQDGSVKNYESLTLITGVFTTPHLLANGKIKINPADIVAYQNKDHYAVSQSTFTSGRRTCAAVETLPGFAVRVAKGKVNVYCKKYYNGHRAVDEYFVQKGNDGEILAFSENVMKDMIKDAPEAAGLFKGKKFAGTATKKMQAATQHPNDLRMVSKK